MQRSGKQVCLFFLLQLLADAQYAEGIVVIVRENDCRGRESLSKQAE